MTKIKDILSIHLEEDIKSVINLNEQDEQSVIDELDGFILTESLARHLTDFCDFYTSDTKQPGLWLSGFYGSGKSYFSKMIGFLLKNPVLKGTSVRERFANKLIGLTDASLVQNSINELGRTENFVVLFDVAKANGNHGISYMMMGAFLKALNLNDDWIGIIEFNLLMSGRYEQFCAKVQQKYGESWVKRRASMDYVYDTFEETMTDGFCTATAYEEMKKAAQKRIEDYDANKLHEDLKRYLEKNRDVRVVFMLDEVSEAITQQKINILDLEGMAEAMVALGRRVWIIAIAQLQLDDVINSTNVNRSLLTKIIDRFRKRIPIAAEEVDTIIRRRLLAKNQEGDRLLQDYYKKNSGQITDITNIVGTGLNKTTDAQTYSDYYPFYEHQFKMLQYFLFGTQRLVKTQVGTRGMLISAFDVLKKEALSDRDMFTHVNSSQLCRQAEEAPAESLRTRYEQADNQLKEVKLKLVKGHEMLQVIHFLTESGAKTTVENISRSYVNCPDDYFALLEEVKQACKILAEKEILILTADEYRITSETQQRIFEMMNNYDGVATYRIKSEVTKVVKKLQLVRQAQNLAVGATTVQFAVQTETGETLCTGGDQGMKVVFHDILSVKPTLGEYVDHVKDETQAERSVVSVIPSADEASNIQSIVDRILRINYIQSVSNLTPEEKKVVGEIENTLEELTRQLEQAVRKSYTEGRIVYLYNSSILSEQNIAQQISEHEMKMYGNIYTKRLNGVLKDSVAMQLLKANGNQLQGIIGQVPDFMFFDTSGQFIGEQLPVVTEIVAMTATYKSGADLERELGAAPTGYSFGTVFSTLAALFRASKIIIKYNNQEYHSYQQEGAREPFVTTRNFQRSYFKSVTQSLTYNEKRYIVDTLKECRYKERIDKDIAKELQNLSYNMNDFELVNAVRLLAQTEIAKVNQIICGDEERERIFHQSLAAKEVLRPYSATVTEYNYINTARTLLGESENEDYCKAVEKIERDIAFVTVNLRSIQRQKEYFESVRNEMELVDIPMQPYDSIRERYDKMLETDPVHCFADMQKECQKLKDLYYQYMEQQSGEMTEGYGQLNSRIEKLRAEADKYPKEWNRSLYSRLEDMATTCKRHVVSKIELRDYDIRCNRSGLQLRDIYNAINLLPSLQTRIDVLETELNRSNPNATQQPQTQPKTDAQSQAAAAAATAEQPQTAEPAQQPAPTVRKLREQMPKGELTVAEYKEWLKQQLAMVNQFKATDILKFD